jgi:hypothetical protein
MFYPSFLKSPNMIKQKVHAFNFKGGPTESGTTQPVFQPVGGEILPFNLLSVLPKYWIMLALLLIPPAFVLYKRRDLAMNLINRLLF